MKNKLNLPNKIHFIGIGGAGMNPLAGICLKENIKVTGSDSTPNKNQDELRALGADIWTPHSAEELAKRELPDICVYSTAIPSDNPEIIYLKEKGIPFWHRSDLLEQIANNFEKQIVIAGTHGKTTTTAMLVWILEKAGLKPCWVLGGVLKGLGSYGWSEQREIFVFEGDESDQSFLKSKPYIGLVTSLEPDHLENYNNSFEEQIKKFGEFAAKCKNFICHENIQKYFEINNLQTYKYSEDLKGELKVSGEHNYSNALGALSVINNLNIGIFGLIYKQFKNKPQEAIEHLLKVRSGEAAGALYHPEIGEIDLVWGEAGEQGYGLAHILEKHGLQVAYELPHIIEKGGIIKQFSDRIIIQTERHKAIIRLTWNYKEKMWIVCAFERIDALNDRRSDFIVSEMTQRRIPVSKSTETFLRPNINYTSKNISENTKTSFEQAIINIRQKALTEPNCKDFLDYALVSDKQAEILANILFENTGEKINFKNYKRCITCDEIRKIERKHGLDHEVFEDQEFIIESDYLLLPEILNNPDKIIYVGQSKNYKLNLFRYSKQINGTLYLIEEIRTRREKLNLLSMYKKKNPSAKSEVTFVMPDALPESSPQANVLNDNNQDFNINYTSKNISENTENICENTKTFFEQAIEYLQSFSGIYRRFEIIGTTKNNITVIDDYAHHPTEVQAAIQAGHEFLKQKNKNGKLIVCFQPHLPTRLRDLWQEFCICFKQADQLFLADLYIARGKPIEGINSENLFAQIKHNHKNYIKGKAENLIEPVCQAAQKNDLILILGAGDITYIRERLLEALEVKICGV